jgi:hypothetical protein
MKTRGSASLLETQQDCLFVECCVQTDMDDSNPQVFGAESQDAANLLLTSRVRRRSLMKTRLEYAPYILRPAGQELSSFLVLTTMNSLAVRDSVSLSNCALPVPLLAVFPGSLGSRDDLSWLFRSYSVARHCCVC